MTHEQIQLAAYYIWETNPESDAVDNWLEAERGLQSDAEMLKSFNVDMTPAPNAKL